MQFDSQLSYLHKHLFECSWSCKTLNIELLKLKESQGCSAIHRIRPWIKLNAIHKLSLTSDTASWKHFTLMFSLSFPSSDHAPTIAETAFKVNRIRLCQTNTTVFRNVWYLLPSTLGQTCLQWKWCSWCWWIVSKTFRLSCIALQSRRRMCL